MAYMLEFCNEQERLLVRILKGRTAALSGPELAAMLATTDRQVRAMISHMRKDHCAPICSTPAEGFYWPRYRSQAEHTLAQLRSRIADLELVVEGIERGLELEFGPQLQMAVEL